MVCSLKDSPAHPAARVPDGRAGQEKASGGEAQAHSCALIKGRQDGLKPSVIPGVNGLSKEDWTDALEFHTYPSCLPDCMPQTPPDSLSWLLNGSLLPKAETVLVG